MQACCIKDCGILTENQACRKHSCKPPECLNPVSPRTSFCKDHTCKAAQCEEPRNDKGYYCIYHQCTIRSCQSPKQTIHFCKKHEYEEQLPVPAGKCHECSKSLVHTYDVYCWDHVCDVDSCLNKSLPGSRRCKGHKDSLVTYGRNYRDLCEAKNCFKNTKPGRQARYCWDHGCKVPVCSRPNVKGRSENCWKHTCLVTDCEEPKLFDSRFCVVHTYMHKPSCIRTLVYFCHDIVAWLVPCARPEQNYED